jgi:hypothetical protein
MLELVRTLVQKQGIFCFYVLYRGIKTDSDMEIITS